MSASVGTFYNRSCRVSDRRGDPVGLACGVRDGVVGFGLEEKRGDRRPDIKKTVEAAKRAMYAEPRVRQEGGPVNPIRSG